MVDEQRSPRSAAPAVTWPRSAASGTTSTAGRAPLCSAGPRWCSLPRSIAGRDHRERRPPRPRPPVRRRSTAHTPKITEALPRPHLRGKHGGRRPATAACCSCADIKKLTDPLQTSLDTLVASVGKLPAGGDSVQTTLATLQSIVADIPKHNALVTLGALQAVAGRQADRDQGRRYWIPRQSSPWTPDRSVPTRRSSTYRVDDGSQVSAVAIEDVTDF